MRNGPAFRFIPELINGITVIQADYNNPTSLYIDAAMETVRLAGSLYSYFEEKKHVLKLENQLKEVHMKKTLEYDTYLKCLRKERLELLENDYIKFKDELQNRNELTTSMRPFLEETRNILESTIELLIATNSDSSQELIDERNEIYRRSFRDYQRLLQIMI